MSPFDILNVPETTDDATVRNAYLAAVRNFPPSSNPILFSRIAAAYAKINTAEKRQAYRVTGQPEVADGELIDQAVAYAISKRQRPAFASLQKSLADINRKREATRS